MVLSTITKIAKIKAMDSREINQLKKKLEEIELQFEEFDIQDIGSEKYENTVSEVYELEEKISEYIGDVDSPFFSHLIRLHKRIKDLKKENEFYDEDAELDNMFPNRHDEDFDDDDMSYNSVFGSD